MAHSRINGRRRWWAGQANTRGASTGRGKPTVSRSGARPAASAGRSASTGSVLLGVYSGTFAWYTARVVSWHEGQYRRTAMVQEPGHRALRGEGGWVATEPRPARGHTRPGRERHG